MKITFCLITCNSDYYLERWLQHYYPVADYIVIAEGATKSWIEVHGWENPSSKDHTIDILKNFPDPEKKIFVHYAKKPYLEKCEQTNEYMKLVPHDTDYIWLADTDEFYFHDDIEYMKYQLRSHAYTHVEFTMYNFFKYYNVVGMGGKPWGYDNPIARIFKYYPGAMFTNHRPMTLPDKSGRDLKQINPHLSEIKCYHYSYIVHKEVYDKLLYYSKVFKFDYIKNWYDPVWCKWSPDNWQEIEKNYSLHPTGKGAYTTIYEGKHPIKIE
jgi:hypothetical protein